MPSSIESVILTEEEVPPYAAGCMKCELAGQRRRMVWGEGNPGAPVFILLDNPGAREDKDGQAFVCGTRDTLQQGLRETGIALDQIYVSYLLKCRPIRAYDKPAARAACSPHLAFQLERQKPRILLGLGNTVVQELYQSEEKDVKSLRGRWHDYEGIPAVFSYHPLAVRRRPVLMRYLLEDLALVREKLMVLAP
ncbi:uracil-DNA glycosylase [Paenibacillus sambharensis]|uniref:uracil-DNA glycosylase n=1 Tax=Paenibacillus sambharensis TaxID=1803190 RepID=UPI001FEB19EB|nr:uracil-DNA glycosylase [Paenibacillus sambharensis]